MNIDQMQENLKKKFGSSSKIKIKVPSLDDYKNVNKDEMRPYDDALKSPSITELSTNQVETQLDKLNNKTESRKKRLESKPDNKNEGLQLAKPTKLIHTNIEPSANANILPAKETHKIPNKRHKRDTTINHFVDNSKTKNPIKDTKETHTKTQKLDGRGRPRIEKMTYLKLTGNALKIVKEIYLQCVSIQALETDFIEKKLFSERTGVKIGSIKTTCYRLKDWEILVDFITTKGRGSKWKFILSKEIYNDITTHKYSSKPSNSCVSDDHNIAAIRDTDGDTNIPSSSRINNINKTTTILPEKWQKIKYQHLTEVLDEFGERFNKNILVSIYNEVNNLLSPEEVQLSIDRFAYGLKNFKNEKKYQRKVRIANLIETLKDGSAWFEDRYLDEEEQKQLKRRKQATEHVEKNYKEKYFLAFFDQLSEEEKLQLLPDDFKSDYRYEYGNEDMRKFLTRDFLKDYYINNLWKDQRDELVNEMMELLD